MNESIGRYLHGGMLVLNQSTEARVAARAMFERKVGCVVVCDDQGQMVGIVTDRDLAAQVVGFGESPTSPLSELMTPEIFKIRDNGALTDVIRLMEEQGVRRIPVVHPTSSGGERCVGMVSLDDLIADQAVEPSVVARIVKSQIERRRWSVTRSQSHDEKLEHSLNHFHALVAERTGLAKPIAEDLGFYLLCQVVKRLPVSGAVQFISQLPQLLHEDLLDLPAGPNRNVDAVGIVNGLSEKFGWKEPEARRYAERFWKALTEATGGSGETAHVLQQIPQDLRTLFTGTPYRYPGSILSVIARSQTAN